MTALDSPWRFILTDETGVVFGELTNARDRQITTSIHGIPSLSFTVRVEHALADMLLNEECRVKAYRGTSLQFHGPVVTAEEVGDSEAQTIRVNAAGAWWYATKRFLPTTLTENGGSFTATGGRNLSKLLLTHANGLYLDPDNTTPPLNPTETLNLQDLFTGIGF